MANGKKSILDNSGKIRLVKWLMQNEASLQGWTIQAITDRVSKELKISLAVSTVKRTIDDGELGIKYKRANGGAPPMAQLFGRVDRLEEALQKLCVTVGLNPMDIMPPKNQDNDE